MIMTFSNFTKLTIILLSCSIGIQVVSFIMLYLSNRFTFRKFTTKLRDFDALVNKLEERLNTATPAPPMVSAPDNNANHNTHVAYQTANRLIKQGVESEKIVDECGLSKGEVELLMAINDNA